MWMWRKAKFNWLDRLTTRGRPGMSRRRENVQSTGRVNFERRGQDSNLRTSFPVTALAKPRYRPLSHLSGGRSGHGGRVLAEATILIVLDGGASQFSGSRPFRMG